MYQPQTLRLHQLPLNKVAEIVGADAVMFVTLQQYGSKYQVINSATTVQVKARLVDTKTGLLLWEGTGVAQQNSGGTGNIFADLIAAAITQAVNSGTDSALDTCRLANVNLFYTKNYGLLYGPYSPEYGKAK